MRTKQVRDGLGKELDMSGRFEGRKIETWQAMRKSGKDGDKGDGGHFTGLIESVKNSRVFFCAEFVRQVLQ